MSRLPKVCIIGAGSSGIAAAKEFFQQNIPYDCFEKSDQVGGNWVFKNANGMSSAYRSLHINTSRDKMNYADFPMPRDYPDYPHHAQIAQYFNDYVDHFGFRDTITFQTAVTHAQRGDDGLWRIMLDTGEERTYDALVVANGHHWDPRWPEPAYPGRFNGQQIHSHAYIDPTDPVDMMDRNVLLVGFGNSALDIACELGRVGMARNLYMSVRRGYWVLPRYFGNRVLDFDVAHPADDPPLLQRLLPRGLLVWVVKRRIETVMGHPTAHGLPEPASITATHPAISQDIYNRIGSGDVKIRPTIQALEGDRVAFTDGTVEDIDVIVWCTGYKITFPFFDQGFLSTDNNDVALWKRMMVPDCPNLFFIGLVQPLCAIMPIAEQQSKLVSAYLTGQYHLPATTRMEQERAAMHARIKAGYVDSPRHTIQIDCGEYTYDLRRELKRGRKRAAAAGHTLSVPGRADPVPLAAE